MSSVMSLVETITRLGFTPNLVQAWLTSFAIGVVVAAPTAILVAPGAQRLVGHLTTARARPARVPPVAGSRRARRLARQGMDRPSDRNLDVQHPGTAKTREHWVRARW
jgi:hypothetical protein